MVGKLILKRDIENLRRRIGSGCAETFINQLWLCHFPHKHLHKATASSIPAVPVEGLRIIRCDCWRQWLSDISYHVSRHLSMSTS